MRAKGCMGHVLWRGRRNCLARMVTVIVTVFEAADLTVSDKKTEAMLLRPPDQTLLVPSLVIEAVGQRCKQTARLVYLGGTIHDNADVSFEIDRRTRLMRACLKRVGPELYDKTTAPISLKVRTPKTEVIETRGCVK